MLTVLLILLLTKQLYIDHTCHSPHIDITSNINPFNNHWGKFQPLALKTLQKLTDMLDHHQIQYFIAYGTLLGFARNGKLIPWDNDIDIIIIGEPTIVRPILSQSMNLTTHPLGIDKVYLNEALSIKGWNWGCKVCYLTR